MTKANRGFTLMHNRSKFHEKRGFRLEQIRQKQAKGFGRTPSFRHDIGFRLEQIRLKQTKGFGKASGFGCVKRSIFGTLSLQAEQTEGLAVPRKAIGYRMGINGLLMLQYMREKTKVSASYCVLNHRPPHQASHHATPDPSGGNAAVVRDKKVMRLSVLPDNRRTTFSIPYLCHTYLNKRECCQTYSNLDCH